MRMWQRIKNVFVMCHPLWTPAYQSYDSAGDEAEPYCSNCETYFNDDDTYCSGCGRWIDWYFHEREKYQSEQQ